MAKILNIPDAEIFPYRIDTAVLEFNGKEIMVDAERFDLRKVSEDDIARACGNATWNRRAGEERTGRFSVVTGLDSAVYVVKPEGSSVAKVGLTANPVKRMESLQCGNHAQLVMTHLFWLPHQAAVGLEKFVLRLAGKIGARLKSEWVDMPSDDLALIVATLAKESGLPLSDSLMFRRTLKRALRQVSGEVDSHAYFRDPEAILLHRQHGC